MKMIDISGRFADNAICEKEHRIGVFHWTGGPTAEGAIEWLDKRKGGKGSVGYNYVIDRDGTVFILADPRTSWMHNSGLGTAYDRHTVSISFAAKNAAHGITEEQTRAAHSLVVLLESWFDISWTHHAAINSHKQDFPAEMWEELKPKLGI